MGDLFQFVDLFAGIGGFHHALEELGGKCVLAVEIDDEAQRVYSSQFPETPIVGDIRSITRCPDGSDRPLAGIGDLVPEHEVLCAGFPCQPFSKSGFQEGVRDKTRGTLFFDIMEIIRARSPKFVILENVRNLAGPRHRETWRIIIDSLRAENYVVSNSPLIFSPHLLSPEQGGAPQIRDRVFILGWKNPKGLPLAAPENPLVEHKHVKGWNPKNWRIESQLDKDRDIADIGRYALRPEEIGWLEAWQAFIQMIPSDWLPGFPIWADDFRIDPDIPEGAPKWKRDFLLKNAEFYSRYPDIIDAWRERRWGPLKQKVEEFPPSRRKFEWQARSVQPKAKDRDLWKLVIHIRPSGIRVKPATYLPALVAITQTSVIGSRRRRITPREAAHLQGFPPDVFERAGVDDSDAYRQLGNAVNVGVVKHMAKALFDAAGFSDFSYVGDDRGGVSEYTRPQSQIALF